MQATASLSHRNLGQFFALGRPYHTVEDAQRFLADYRERILAALKNVEVSGQGVSLELPANLPACGDCVYIIDEKLGEVQEVVIAWLGRGREYGPIHVGCDPGLGNPETSFQRITKWWSTLKEALDSLGAGANSYKVVSKVELARRAGAEIDEIFSRAEKHHRSPQGQASMRSLGEFLRQL